MLKLRLGFWLASYWLRRFRNPGARSGGNSDPMLTPSQQDQIVQLAKNLSRQKQKAKTMTRSGFMSSKQKSDTLQRAEAKLRDYLKEF